MAVRVLPSARLRRVALGGPLALTAFYTAVALVATWPGVRTLSSAFISFEGEGYGEPVAGDHLQSAYRFWLAGHQLWHGNAPWIDPYSFQPIVEQQAVLGQWPFALPFWPLYALFGPVVAWNLLLLGTVVAAGLLTYAWLRALGVAPAGALVGGLVFAIAPYRLAQSGVHLLGWVAIFLPLTLLAIERARAAPTRRAAHGWGALAALALVSIPLSGQVHLAIGAIPLALAYAACRFERLSAAWATLGAAATIGVGLAVRYTVIAGSAEEGGRSLAEVRKFSAEPIDLLSRWRLGGLEEYIYLGWLTPVLAAAGVAVLWRSGRRGLALLLGIAAVLPPVLALGTHLPLYSWLWNALPPLRYPRVPGRFLPIADLALAALAAVAVADALARTRRRAHAAAATLLVLVALDLGVLPLAALVSDQDNRAYAALRTAPPGRVLDLPLFEPGVHVASVYDYYALQARRERLSGYSSLAPPEALAFYFTFNRISCGVWLPGDEAFLRARGVEYATFHGGLYAQGKVRGAWFGWRGLLEHGWAPRVTDGAVTFLARGRSRSPAPVREPPRSRPVFCEGWKGRTMDERQAPLWVYGSGPLTLRVGAPEPTRAALWVDGERLPDTDVARERMLAAELPGERWHSVVLEVPRLVGTAQPRGLTLYELRLG
jgi:uncharacterized membrane protein (DUF485 family)